jgi:hypothetical protein
MSVILDTMTDILVDGMACPRCLTADYFSKPNMNIQWYAKFQPRLNKYLRF